MRISKNMSKVLLALVFSLTLVPTLFAAERWDIQPVVTGLDAPWGVAPLPEGGALITERDGALVWFDGKTKRRIGNVPRVVARGQGGLLDITLARDFERSRVLFLTYAKRQARGGSGTALARAVWAAGAEALTEVRDIFEIKVGSSGGRHFGSRVVQAPDGTLFMTIGDRGDRASAQDTTLHNGSVIRVNPDGSVPADNPFVGQGKVLPEIWSFGHRNPQGAGLDLRGNLWVAEHGARGGDEVNAVKKGANFGWPVISYGKHYSGARIGEGTRKAGMEQPEHYWDPSIAPSGLLVYDGDAFPGWRGDMFVGSLKFDYISRLSGSPLREVDQIETPETSRVRDIVAGPDGEIWFISVGEGSVFRILPQEG